MRGKGINCPSLQSTFSILHTEILHQLFCILVAKEANQGKKESSVDHETTVQDSDVHLHLKEKGHSFEGTIVHISNREDRQFGGGKKGASCQTGTTITKTCGIKHQPSCLNPHSRDPNSSGWHGGVMKFILLQAGIK